MEGIKIQEEISKTKEMVILIVDDDISEINLLKDILSEEGYENVFTASSGSEALLRIDERKPDLLLLDIKMPDMDGFEFFGTLRENEETSDISLIMLTCEISEEDLKRGFEVGVSDYIEKPFDRIKLIACTESALRLKLSKDQFRSYREKNEEYIDKLVKERTEELKNINEGLNKEIYNYKHRIESLFESEKKFREIFENVNDEILYIDKYGKMLDVNTKSEDIFLFKPEELIGKNLFRLGLLGDEALNEIVKVYKDLFGEGKSSRFMEIEVSDKKGNKIPVEVGVNAIKRDSKITGALCTIRDITDRKKAEAELRESEKRYSTLINSSPDGILLIQDNNVVFSNKKLREMTGYGEIDLKTLNLFDLIPKDQLLNLFKKYEESRRDKKTPPVSQLQIKKKSGGSILVEVNINRIEFNGNPADLLFIRNISERMNLEDSLRELEGTYSDIVEESNDGIIILKGMSVAYANKRVLEMTGYSLDQIGSNVLKFINPKQVKKIANIFRRRMAGDKDVPSTYELEMVHKDGHIIPVEVSAIKIEYQGEPGDVVFFRDITDRKQAEEKIKAEQQKYQNVVENIEEGLFTLNKKGYLTYANPEASVKITGYTSEELIGMYMGKMMEIKTAPSVLSTLGQCFRGKSVHNFEAELKKKDGTFAPMEVSLTPKMVNGKLTEIFGIIRDITDRKKAEEKIKTEQQKYQNVVENIGEGLFVTDKIGNITYVNPKAERMSGYKAEELIGIHFTAIVPKEIQKIVLPGIQKMLKGGSISGIESKFLKKDGTQIFIEITITPEMKDGKIEGILGVIRDITERKHSEDALRESEEKYSTLVEMSDDGIALIQRGKVIFANPSALNMFGFNGSEVIGKNIFGLLSGLLSEQLKAMSEDEVQMVTKTLLGASKGWAKSHSYQVRTKKRSGEVIWVDIRDNSIIYKGENAVLLLLGDITERKHQEEKLRKTIEDLERSNKELGQFAYIASHDLQEPLRLIGSYVQLLSIRYKGKLDSDADEFIDYAVEGAKSLRDRINSLLEYSRVGTKGKPLKPTDCEAVLEMALENLTILIEKSGAVVTHDPMPKVVADGAQIVSVFQNLIENAIMYCDENQPLIHISARKKDDEWVFSVKDNGIGIEWDYRKYIFLIFRVLDKERSGTGTGLAVCKKIVERHGGRIWMESKPGSGSTFYFTIPVGGEKRETIQVS